jgi:hypothetical protein
VTCGRITGASDMPTLLRGAHRTSCTASGALAGLQSFVDRSCARRIAIQARRDAAHWILLAMSLCPASSRRQTPKYGGINQPR